MVAICTSFESPPFEVETLWMLDAPSGLSGGSAITSLSVAQLLRAIAKQLLTDAVFHTLRPLHLLYSFRNPHGIRMATALSPQFTQSLYPPLTGFAMLASTLDCALSAAASPTWTPQDNEMIYPCNSLFPGAHNFPELSHFILILKVPLQFTSEPCRRIAVETLLLPLALQRRVAGMGQGSGAENTAEAFYSERHAIEASIAPALSSSESQAIEASIAHVLSSSESQAIEASIAHVLSSSESQAIEASIAHVLSSSESQAIEASIAPALSSSESQAIEASIAHVLSSSESQAIEASIAPALSSSESQAIEASIAHALSSSESQAIEASIAHVLSSSESQAIEASIPQVLPSPSADSQILPNFAEIYTPSRTTSTQENLCLSVLAPSPLSFPILPGGFCEFAETSLGLDIFSAIKSSEGGRRRLLWDGIRNHQSVCDILRQAGCYNLKNLKGGYQLPSGKTIPYSNILQELGWGRQAFLRKLSTYDWCRELANTRCWNPALLSSKSAPLHPARIAKWKSNRALLQVWKGICAMFSQHGFATRDQSPRETSDPFETWAAALRETSLKSRFKIEIFLRR
ncbi:hypothetical protein DFH05DRAFT_1524643 [Lentinula detonsa]|uniref:Uncharacterized protein n=1 Tax=Lentinula detonsa TaxID=2804962 RepID=A0A9W8P1F8_9AGAR|nr:hypothetical protein DFH05DRAFT_1524643 [Lentinula detonsa]